MNAVFPVILCVAIILPSHIVATVDTWRTEILVTSSENENNKCCTQNITTQRMICSSVNKALSCLHIAGNSTVVYLQDGIHFLTDGPENEIRYMSDIAIIGLSHDSVNVTCDAPDAGLAFVQSTRITLTNFTLQNCSAFRNSTSTDYTTTAPFSFLQYRVAMYILMCTDLTVNNVVIGKNHKGAGMTLYNVGGKVEIRNSMFLYNQGRPGGGGLQIEFSYCIPGDLSCSVPQIEPCYSSNSTYYITNCVFNHNIGYRGYSGLRKVPNAGRTAFSFGRGGGLSLIFKGTANNNVIIINNSMIHHNIAHYGGGLYTSFHDDASNNTLVVEGVSFKGNEVIEKDREVYDVDGGGGGMKVIMDNGEHGTSSFNTVKISGCNFTSNQAIIGGGLWVENNLNSQTTGDLVLIENCSFFNNTAFLGSAIYLSAGFRKKTAKLTFAKLTISINVLKCSETLPYTFLPCSGILYSVNVPFTMNGSSAFYNNNASGIEMHEAVMTVSEEASLKFESNVSPYGPCIALYDCSYMILEENTSLLFVNNTALKSGGAIYADSCSGGIQPADASSECFIQYYDKEVHPDNWNTEFTFSNNTDNTGRNSLFAVSLSACWWPLVNATFIYKSFRDFKGIRDTFCWKSWHYVEDENYCESEVRSGPALLTFDNIISPMRIPPGGYIAIPEVKDGKLRTIKTDSLQACIVYGPASFSPNTTKRCQNQHNGGHLYLYQTGIDGHNKISSSTIHITIEILNAGPGAVFKPSLDVSFTSCPYPFVLSDNNAVYLYGFDYFSCSRSYERLCEIGSDVTVKPYYCISNSSNGENTSVVGLCPRSYNGLPRYNYISNYSNGSNCAHGHSGKLCGSCKPDYCVPVNSFSYDCVDSSKISIPGSLLFILLQIIPVSLLIFFVIFLNIDLTQGYMTGFVFYCQVVSLNFPIWTYPTWLTADLPHSLLRSPTANIFKVKYETAPYRIFNLDFLTVYDCETIPICITKHMDPMGVIAFSYVVPFYCILVVVFLSVWLTMYERGRSCVIKVTRPIHQCFARIWRKLNINPSFIKSFASLYILCFTPMAVTSFQLLHYVTWHSLENKETAGVAYFYNADYEYFGYPHCLLGILAIFVLLFLCILPAVFLMLYPYQAFHRTLDRLKLRHHSLIVFADVHSASFCNGLKNTKDFRSFSGLYLLLRLVIMTFYYIPGHYYTTINILEILTSLVFGGVIMIFRPFKQAAVNFTNFLIFVLLGGMCVVSLTLQGKGRSANMKFIMHLPLLTLIVYFVYCLCKWCYMRSCAQKSVKSKKIYFTEVEPTSTTNATRIESEPTSTDVLTDPYTDDSLPDRIENPDDYSKLAAGRSRFSANDSGLTQVRLMRTTTIGGRHKRKDYGTY